MNKQIDGWTDRQINGWMERQMQGYRLDRLTDIERHMDKWTMERQIHTHTNSQRERERERERDKRTRKHKDRQTDHYRSFCKAKLIKQISQALFAMKKQQIHKQNRPALGSVMFYIEVTDV
jgi:hypothetical protein